MPNPIALTTRWLAGAALALTAALASAQTISITASSGPAPLQVRHGPHQNMHQPPPPRYESRPRYRKGHVWVSGQWRWQGHRQVWVPGYWAKAKRHHRPHYDHHGYRR